MCQLRTQILPCAGDLVSLHNFLLSGLLVVVFSLTALAPAASYQASTDVEQAQMLEAHLEVRERVYPPASDMLLMVRSFLIRPWLVTNLSAPQVAPRDNVLGST